MTACVRRSHSQYVNGSWDQRLLVRQGAFCDCSMTKSYEFRTEKLPLGSGGFFEAVRLALVEMTRMGPEPLDLSGYPHESEAHALYADMEALAFDLRRATDRLKNEAHALGEHRHCDEETKGAEQEGRTTVGG